MSESEKSPLSFPDQLRQQAGLPLRGDVPLQANEIGPYCDAIVSLRPLDQHASRSIESEDAPLDKGGKVPRREVE